MSKKEITVPCYSDLLESDGMKEHMITVGGKGVGKSELSRKALGMTHDEYEAYAKYLDEMLKKEQERRKIMEEFGQWKYIYWLGKAVEGSEE